MIHSSVFHNAQYNRYRPRARLAEPSDPVHKASWDDLWQNGLNAKQGLGMLELDPVHSLPGYLRLFRASDPEQDRERREQILAKLTSRASCFIPSAGLFTTSTDSNDAMGSLTADQR